MSRGLKIIASSARPLPEISVWSWAVVTATGPLRVKLDGESTALDVTPDTLVPVLAISDRVWVQLVTNADPTRRYRRLVVHGKVTTAMFPVGHVYMSTASTDPGTLFGGTWTRIQDKFLLAAGSTYAAAATGGAPTHTLVEANLPAHVHTINGGTNAVTTSTSSERVLPTAGVGGRMITGSATNIATGSVGSGTAVNHLPPYVAVYVWERTA